MTAPSMAGMNKVFGLKGESEQNGCENVWNQVIMISINQPITQKSKSHSCVFLGKVQLDFTTSTEFKGDKSCLKSHLTWWKEIEEKVIKRTLEDW